MSNLIGQNTLNEDIKKCETPAIVGMIKKQRLQLFGHVIRNNE